MTPYTVLVDGTERKVEHSPATANLAAVLRDELGVDEVKVGCAQGRCGSCAVLLDGVLVASCTVLAADCDGSAVTTVRSLGTEQQPGRVQAALVETGAVQCGFCTPGMVVAAHDLLSREDAPSGTAIRCALSGNLCRCTGYGRIVAAVRSLAP